MNRLLVAGLLGIGLMARGQTPGQTIAHAPDGGTVQLIQSIEVYPLTGAPFTASLVTDWTTILADGSTATIKSRRTIARDSTGRIFQERKRFSADGDVTPTPTRALQYFDPNRHEMYDCIVAQKTCYIRSYRLPPMSAMPTGIGGLQACGCASQQRQGVTVQQEALGQKTIESVDAVGSQEITTLAAGQFGNEKAQPIVKEFWYSPRLGMNLVTKRFDPRAGSQNLSVDTLSLNEPDQAMFQPPADFRVVREVVVKQASTQASR
jgi:hypothetical protein